MCPDQPETETEQEAGKRPGPLRVGAQNQATKRRRDRGAEGQARPQAPDVRGQRLRLGLGQRTDPSASAA